MCLCSRHVVVVASWRCRHVCLLCFVMSLWCQQVLPRMPDTIAHGTEKFGFPLFSPQVQCIIQFQVRCSENIYFYLSLVLSSLLYFHFIFTLLVLVTTFRVARLTLQTRKLWLVSRPTVARVTFDLPKCKEPFKNEKKRKRKTKQDKM